MHIYIFICRQDQFACHRHHVKILNSVKIFPTSPVVISASVEKDSLEINVKNTSV